MKNIYKKDLECLEVWKEIKETWSYGRTPHLDSFVQQGIFLKNHQVCIPTRSMRRNLELHNGGLSGHFGIDKTKE